MIRPEKQAAAIRSLHSIFVGVRYIAATEGNLDVIARAADIGELLPTLFERDEDLTEWFREQLTELVKVHPIFGTALETFDGNLR